MRRFASYTIGLWTSAMVAALPAFAEPPPPPRTHARYGPLTQCLHGYAVTASASEAIHVAGEGLSLMGDGAGVHLVRDHVPYDRPGAAAIEVAHLGRVMRYRRVFASAPSRIWVEYLLPGRFGGPAIQARSPAFDGSGRDLALLGRISRVAPRNEACGAFAAPDFRGEDSDALYWSPVTVAGPAYRCQNGIGYRVREGEAVQLQWRPLIPVTIPSSRLLTGGLRLTLDGPITRRDPATRVPLAGYRRSVGIWSGRSILTLTAPESTMSRERLRRFPIQQRDGHNLYVQFPAGGEAAARAFATRLEICG